MVIIPAIQVMRVQAYSNPQTDNAHMQLEFKLLPKI